MMTRATVNGVPTTFGYDYAGNRVRVSTGSATTTYPNTLFNISGATTTKHIFVNGELVAKIIGNGVSTSTYAVHTDHLMGTSVITNASGTVVETTDYYPFGGVRVDSKTTGYAEQRKFTGHEYDGSTDLSYMGARYQNGGRGQFLSEDPSFIAVKESNIQDPQSWNSYGYSRNN